MTINYGYEYKKFEQEQEEQRIYYLSLGMSEEAIAVIADFDKQEFLRGLAYKRNTIPLDITTPFETDDESKNPLYEKNIEKLTVTIDTYTVKPRYGWVDELENPQLIKIVRQLTESQLELITLVAIEGYKKQQVGLILGISPSAVSKRLGRIRKKFQGNFV